MLRISATLICLFVASLAEAQTNPCTAPLQTVFAPTTVLATLTNYTELLPSTTTPRVSEWQMGVFLQGVNPATGSPVTAITIPRVQWTLVGGTADCYRAVPAELLAVPVGVTHFVALRGRNAMEAGGAYGAWSPNSNPFALLAALTPPTAVRVTP